MKNCHQNGFLFMKEPIHAALYTSRPVVLGEGYADLEYGMMKAMGAISDATPVISTVHDSQVFHKIPDRLQGRSQEGGPGVWGGAPTDSIKPTGLVSPRGAKFV